MAEFEAGMLAKELPPLGDDFLTSHRAAVANLEPLLELVGPNGFDNKIIAADTKTFIECLEKLEAFAKQIVGDESDHHDEKVSLCAAVNWDKFVLKAHGGDM